MSDYIDRENAIEAIGNFLSKEDDYFVDMAKGTIKLIPSADVASIRHGIWKSGACSECGGIKPMTRIEDCGLLIWEAPYKLNYCPNCGAKMNGEDKNCDTCKHYDKGWDDAICDGCTTADSRWERRNNE